MSIEIEKSTTRKEYFPLSGLSSTAFGPWLSENQWDAFMMHLEHSNYWLMPIRDDVILFDGAKWVMEGYRETRYHVVDRQSPDEGAYRDACLYLLQQSGLLAETPANEIY